MTLARLRALRHGRHASRPSPQDLLEALPVVTYTAQTGTDGRWLYVSHEVEPMLGYAPKEWMRQPGLWFSRVHPDDRARLQSEEPRRWGQRHSGERIAPLEYRLLHRDGTVVWVLDVGGAEEGPAGEALWQGVLVDVSDRHRREEADALLRAVIASSSDGILVTDREECVVLWGEELERIYGHPASEALGEPLHALLSEEDHADIERVWASLRSEETLKDYNTTRSDREGRRLEIELSGRLVRNSAGEVLGYVLGHRDVTELGRERARREEAEDRFGATFDSGVPTAIITTREREIGGVIAANEAIQRLLGYSRDELVQLEAEEMLHPPDRYDYWREIQSLRAGSTDVARGEIRLRDRDGALVWVDASTRLVPSRGGDCSYLVFHAVAIGERRRLERRDLFLADRDEMTGLLNRRRIEEELERELAGARQFESQGAVGLFHVVGIKDGQRWEADPRAAASIQQLAERLRGLCSDWELVGRIAPRHFAVIMPRSSKADGEARAAELAAAVGQAPGGLSLAPAARAWPAAGVGSAQQLLATEDPAGTVDVLEGWRSRLPQLIGAGELVLLGQRIVPLRGEEEERLALLVGAKDEHGAVVHADEFAPVARHLGLVSDLDTWALGRLSEIGSSSAASAPKLVLRFHSLVLSRPEILGEVIALLAEGGLPPRSVTFTLSDAAVYHDPAGAQHLAREIEQLGQRVAIEGFGSGLGSLLAVEEVEHDELHLDPALVVNLAASQERRVAVKRLVEFAHSRGVTTLAQCVDSDETLTVLREYEVDWASGPAVERTRPFVEFLA